MINDLNKRIEIYGNIEEENELGEVCYKEKLLKTIWAKIVPQTGSLQKQQANTILSNTTHKIIVRYEAAKDITQDMYIKYKNHRFDIKYILDPFFKHIKLEIFCEEIIE